MAESPKDNDQSMEDILQSIKRIIADEGEPSPAMPGSDVLELTELLAEDAAPPAPPPAPAPAPAPSAQDDIDALFNTPEPAPAPAASPQDDIDALFNSPTPEPEPEAVVAAEPEPEPEPIPAPAPAVVASPAAEESLMSESTLTASLEALKALAHKQEAAPTRTSQHFRSGITVEDLVVESLKPMLQEWLDGNLPSLVRSLVEREIRRLNGL